MAARGGAYPSLDFDALCGGGVVDQVMSVGQRRQK
jgi:hypothetical protein